MEFEWDPQKAGANLVKHRVTFQEAAGVFGDRQAISSETPTIRRMKIDTSHLDIRRIIDYWLYRIRNAPDEQESSVPVS